MTGRHPLQSTANLPVKPPPARPGEGFTKPPVLPSRPQPLQPSAVRAHPHTTGGSKPQPGLARPGLMSSGGGSRAPASSSAGKPSRPGGPQSSSSSKPGAPQSSSSSSKPSQPSSSLGATATFGKAAGDKQHRWKLDDFDIGRPLGKVRTVLRQPDISNVNLFSSGEIW